MSLCPVIDESKIVGVVILTGIAFMDNTFIVQS
ncbi:uncharacterized protein METZ01_LOCUS411958 [marine metagenome]|uniref:Uncharacterized protein n=1 Tax=marine metagenome TaxID=408172 RepID=A0A382WKH2_9ZZZZ